MYPAAVTPEYLPGSEQGSQYAAGAFIPQRATPPSRTRGGAIALVTAASPRPHSSRVARHSLPCIRCTQNCCGLS